MLITVKTLQQESFTVEVEPLQSVRQVKEKIEQVKGKDYPAKHQKLMYAGKILCDNNRLSDYGIDEKKFLIILVKKPKLATLQDGDAEDLDSVEVRSVDFSGSDREPFEPRGGAEMPLVSEERHQQLVSQIMEMGYERPEVERSLRASFHNPERAVEYLLTGAFPGSSNEPAAVSTSSNEESSESDVPISVAPNPYMGVNEHDLQRVHSAIEQSARLLAQAAPIQPDAHFPEQQVLSPSHQEAVYHMLQPQSADAEDNNQPSDSVLSRSRSQQDQAAIDRLKQLGFPEYQAIEAYFACERNENSAADFLLSQNYD